MKESNKNKIFVYGSAFSSFILVVLIASIVSNGLGEGNKNLSDSKNDLQVSVASNQELDQNAILDLDGTKVVINDAKYKFLDGSYDVGVGYRVKGHNIEMKFVFEILQDHIRSIKTEISAADPESRFYIEDYEDELSKKIIGKNLEDVSSLYVSGATVTSNAFREAVGELKNSIEV